MRWKFFNDTAITEIYTGEDTLSLHAALPICTHTHEPGCAVKEALSRGEVSLSRYESYLKLLDDDEKYRR